MDITSLENELRQEKLENIYLLYGEERFLLENCLKKIKNIFGEMVKGINYIQIDNTNVQNIISDIETPAFGYPTKIIIAKETGLFQKAKKTKNAENKSENKFENKLADYIKENIDQIKDGVILVFVEQEAEKNTLYKQIESCGIVCNFEKQKPNDIARRMKSICNAYKVNIDVQTMNYFIENCGTSLSELINEIRKQIEYVGPNGTITKQTIDLLATKQFESIIFDLTDSLGKKDIEAALKVLKNLIYAKEPIQKIFITLYNHFKKLYITKIAVKENLNLINSLKLKPNQTFLTTKYKKQAGYFKEEELKKILKEFIELDYKVKNGMMDINIGVESILCRYCS